MTEAVRQTLAELRDRIAILERLVADLNPPRPPLDIATMYPKQPHEK
jgi:hypothetical protein